MPNFDATRNAVWIPEVIANQALGRLGAYLNLGKTVSTDQDLTPVRVGQTISIPRRGTITATQKTQNSQVVSQAPTGTEVLVTVDQHWYVRLLEEDFTHAFQTESVLPGYLEDSVIVLAEKIEASLAALCVNFPNIDAGGSAGDALKGVIDVRTKLIEAYVPVLAKKFGYIAPSFAARLLKEEAFMDPKIIPNNDALTEGAVGRVSGFDMFEGQLVQRNGSPGWLQNMFYTRNAMVLASRPLLSPGRELGVEATTVRSDAGLALRLVRSYSDLDMAVVVQLDTLFGTGVNDVRQGYVLESQ